MSEVVRYASNCTSQSRLNFVQPLNIRYNTNLCALFPTSQFQYSDFILVFSHARSTSRLIRIYTGQSKVFLSLTSIPPTMISIYILTGPMLSMLPVRLCRVNSPSDLFITKCIQPARFDEALLLKFLQFFQLSRSMTIAFVFQTFKQWSLLLF